MLAIIGLLGLAMSSFVMVGDAPANDDTDPQDDPQTDGTDRDTAVLLSNGDGDAGAGGVLTDGAGAGAGGVLTVGAGAGAGGVATDAGDATDDADADFGDDLLPDTATGDDTGGLDPVLPVVDPDPAPAPVQRTGTDLADTITGDAEDEEIRADAGDDIVFGDLGNDLLDGGDGDDTLQAGDGDDILFGGDGDDTLMGGWGNDSLIGGGGADTMMGGGGEDVIDGRTDDETDSRDFLNGGAGDDRIVAGVGDHLNGGDGADTFDLLQAGEVVIDDFDASQDLIEVGYVGEVPTLSTTAGDDGLTLYADGAVVAHLSGVASLDLSRITLTAL